VLGTGYLLGGAEGIEVYIHKNILIHRTGFVYS